MTLPLDPELIQQTKRTREMLEMWEAKRAKEPKRAYRPPDEVRAAPETLAKAIKRHVTKRSRS